MWFKFDKPKREEEKKEEVKTVAIPARKVSFQRDEICVPYGGVRYAAWEEMRPGNYTKGGR